MQKVHDRVASGQQAVGQVADDAAKDEPEGELPQQAVGAEMMAGEIEHHQRRERDGGQQGVVAGEHAPRRPRVDAVREVEKAGNDRIFVPEDDAPQHQPLGDLVADQHAQGQRDNPAGRFRENGRAADMHNLSPD